MIVTYTYYDVDSNVLKGFALDLLELIPKSQSPHVLKPRVGSLAANVQKALLKHPDVPFFFFGHGSKSPGSLLGQDQKDALHQQNLNLLANRLVFAACCYGISTMMPAVTQHHATVLGYDGLLQFSRTDPLVFDAEDCILAGAKALLAGGTARDAYDATYQEYGNVFNRLMAKSFHEQMMAQRYFQPNQQALRLVGNQNKKL